MTSNTTSRASRSEKDDDITKELDVLLQSRSLLLRELLLSRVKSKPSVISSQNRCTGTLRCGALLVFLDINGESLVNGRHIEIFGGGEGEEIELVQIVPNASSIFIS
jgi:hypothetical protein